MPQRIQRMAAIYLGATQWADQVYANASGKAAAEQRLRVTSSPRTRQRRLNARAAAATR